MTTERQPDERKPVKPQGLIVQTDKIGREIGILPAHEGSTNEQQLDPQQLSNAPAVADIGNTPPVAREASAPAEGTPPAPDAAATPPPDIDEYLLPNPVPGHPGKRRAGGKILLQQLQFRWLQLLNESLRQLAKQPEAVLQALAGSDLCERMTTAITKLKDQEQAAAMLERHFELLAANPALLAKIPAGPSLRKVAGGMAADNKTVSGDARRGVIKRGNRASELLDDFDAEASK